ncbi:endonuclease/exonuclease/phosphatase family protein [Colwellia sp. UCD-KL20]|uniref:endonuclease/exonuclease/phosphatase family protein n=1 Tax=Colwellia sp. UCD-KL20 TaxID=1917165 RepID=UPI00097026FC|nr:endonuclease/exonuclease/phosphatase family protein [Colwellia sp. UCD-KL20]
MKKIILLLAILPLLIIGLSMANETETPQKLRIATFNVSMEALNYLPYVKGQAPSVKGNELGTQLKNNHQQIRNIAEIIQRVNPDIILLNEFDREDDSHQAIKLFLSQYLNKSQQGQAAIKFPYFYQGPVNTGIPTSFDLNNDKVKGDSPNDNYGFGYFPGHFGMVLLSKYPLNEKGIRTFQHFKWKDMPNALKPIDPKTNKPWYNDEAWSNFRLSSKSHWDIPVIIGKKTLHVLASHPTPPVFDGPEDRNGKRNHDEIRLWNDYITPHKSDYLYDDNGVKGGIAPNSAFVIMGDQNASSVDGDAIKEGITNLLAHPNIQDSKPGSKGGKAHNPNNPYSKNHTAHWGMRADYVLPSKNLITIINSGVFWPLPTDDEFRLVKDRAASSDHRLIWVDISL